MRRLGHIALCAAILCATLRRVHTAPRYNDSLCDLQLAAYKQGLGAFRPWALQMLDATGTVPSGILTGDWTDLGQFDECLSVETNSTDPVRIRGQYCMVGVPLPQSFAQSKDRAMIQTTIPPQLNIAACFPDACSPDTLQKHLQSDVQYVERLLKLFAHLRLNVTLTGVSMCQTLESQPEWRGEDWAAAAVLCAAVLLVALSTAYDVCTEWYQMAERPQALLAFSALTNGRKLLKTSHFGGGDTQLGCVHGIRFLSMLWVIYGHTFVAELVHPLINLADLQPWIKDAWNMDVMGATVAVDSFFVLSGLLVSYGFLHVKHRGRPFNVFLFYLHRYLRLTPALAAVVLVHATFIMRLGSGPYWPLLDTVLREPCRDNWWATLLYCLNYVNVDKMCIGQTWYLGVDTQLYLLAPLLLLPLWRKPVPTLWLCGLLYVASFVSPFLVSWHYKLGGLSMATTNDPNYMSKYYYVTHVRYGPWLCGFVLGYVLFNAHTKGRIRLSKATVLAGWAASLVTMAAVVFGGHSLTEHAYDRLESSCYNAFHRNAWGLALAWVLLACSQGYGGPVDRFLSWSVFQVLGRFTYSVYLVHMSVQVMMGGGARTAEYFSNTHNMFVFWSYVAFSLALAVGLTLTFESPFIALEKLLLSPCNASKKPQRSDQTRIVQ